jgi:hypothetical protein
MQKESVYDRMTHAEREVANVLKELKIQWTYEQPVFVWDEDGRPRVWAPDFYLTQFGIYLEVCGSRDFNYEYRRRVFSQNGYSVIFLHVFKGSNLWEFHFKKSLEYFHLRRSQFFSTIIRSDLLAHQGN